MLLWDFVHIPPVLSLAIVLLTLLVSGLASWVVERREKVHSLSHR
ncbi:hypothetical protein [Thermoflexus hugenholtzii]